MILKLCTVRMSIEDRHRPGGPQAPKRLKPNSKRNQTSNTATSIRTFAHLLPAFSHMVRVVIYHLIHYQKLSLL